MRRWRSDQWLSAMLVLMGGAMMMWQWLPQVSALIAGVQIPSLTHQSVLPELISPAPVPVYHGEASQPQADADLPFLTATAVYIMDRGSGSVLYELNSHTARYPASTAKMMTAVVARRVYPLDQEMQVKQEAFTTGTTAKLQLGEKLTVENLLRALLIPSGNDAAFVLATHHPLGYEGFTAAMNNVAKELHLDESHFSNPSGLDEQAQTASAHDLAILANEILKDPLLREIVGTRSTVVTDVTGQVRHALQNTQELLGTVEGVIGVKTGTTEFAGENLITAVQRDGHEVIIVVLGSQQRYPETKALIRWVFDKYQWQNPARD